MVKRKDSTFYKTNIQNLFDKYGIISNIVVKKCSALVEFENIDAARIALNVEKGFPGNPLVIKPLFEDTESKHIFTKYPCMKSKSSVNDSILEMEEFVFSKMLNNLLFGFISKALYRNID